MSEPVFFCRTNVEEFRGGGLSKWPESPPKKLTWASQGAVGRVSAEDFRGIIPFGLAKIEAVCGLQFEYTTNGKTANWLFRGAALGTSGMGSKGGVLAQAMLPPPGLPLNASFQSILEFDPAEIWSSADDMLNGAIPMAVVIAHEGGHAAGCGHGNDPRDLMYPSLTPGVTEFSGWSVAELRKRYGQPAPKPPSAPPNGRVVWRIQGSGYLFEFDEGTLGPPAFYRDGVLQAFKPSSFQ